MQEKRPASEKRLAANRRNAQRSTGPRTQEGKAVSSRNSLKHGLRSQTILVPGECEKDYTTFRDQLREDLQPSGALEELLVGRAITIGWRLQRLTRIEAAMFYRAYFSAREGSAEREIAKHIQDPSDKIFEELDGPPIILDEQAYREAKAAAQAAVAGRDAEIADLGATFLAEENAKKLALYVRYEQGLERSLFRTLHELERVQARRSGTGVATPAIVDVSVDADAGQP